MTGRKMDGDNKTDVDRVMKNGELYGEMDEGESGTSGHGCVRWKSV